VGPTLQQIQRQYGDDVRIVFKHNPLSFHKSAMPAANAVECAREQGKFWEYHDKLFQNQKQLTPANYERYAKELGLDVAEWMQCYATEKHKQRILRDQRKAMSLGARGTPAFFVNGRFLSGAQPFSAFKTLIDQELSKAKASGIAKKDYYQKGVVAKGRTRL
jgi:protein-disulfide isomerase